MLSPTSYTFACINLITYTPIGLGIWLVELPSRIVISYCTSLPSYMMWIYGFWFRIESFVFHLL
jgi:hypothetical protein